MKKLHLVSACLLLVALTCVLGISAIAHEHHTGDWSFGISDGNASVIEPKPDDIEPIYLTPFVGGLFNGDWGIELWNLPDPDLKFVRLLFTSAPTGLVIYHESELVLGCYDGYTGPGFFDLSWPEPGIYHAHLDVYATAPGDYTVTFKLVDAVANDSQHTQIGDSKEYAVEFVTIPEPSPLLALAIPIAVLVLRRRK
jgi:hypothetical protein